MAYFHDVEAGRGRCPGFSHVCTIFLSPLSVLQRRASPSLKGSDFTYMICPSKKNSATGRRGKVPPTKQIVHFGCCWLEKKILLRETSKASWRGPQALEKEEQQRKLVLQRHTAGTCICGSQNSPLLSGTRGSNMQNHSMKQFLCKLLLFFSR